MKNRLILSLLILCTTALHPQNLKRDQTAIVQSMIDSCEQNSIPVLKIDNKTFYIAGRLVFPANVALQSVSKSSLNFILLDSAAGIDFSQRKYYGQNNIPRRDECGNFTVNGNGIAKNPVYFGYGAKEVFRNIDVFNSADVGAIVDELQNSSFYNCSFNGNKNGNLLIRNSCRTLDFTSCYFSGAQQYGIKITQEGYTINSGGDSANLVTKLINFHSVLIERIDSKVAVYIDAGTDITFECINTSNSGVVIRRKLNTDRINFNGGEIVNPSGVAISALGGTKTRPINILLDGNIHFREADIALEVNEGTVIKKSSYYLGKIKTFIHTVTQSDTTQKIKAAFQPVIGLMPFIVAQPYGARVIRDNTIVDVFYDYDYRKGNLSRLNSWDTLLLNIVHQYGYASDTDVYKKILLQLVPMVDTPFAVAIENEETDFSRHDITTLPEYENELTSAVHSFPYLRIINGGFTFVREWYWSKTHDTAFFNHNISAFRQAQLKNNSLDLSVLNNYVDFLRDLKGLWAINIHELYITDTAEFAGLYRMIDYFKKYTGQTIVTNECGMYVSNVELLKRLKQMAIDKQMPLLSFYSGEDINKPAQHITAEMWQQVSN